AAPRPCRAAPAPACARLVAPRDLETAAEAEEVLDRIEVAVQAGSVARLALGNADDQAARALDRCAGAAALVIRPRHHRIDPPRRHLLPRAGRNVVGLEILPLVGLKLVEPGDAGFHLLRSDGFRSHRSSSISGVSTTGVEIAAWIASAVHGACLARRPTESIA